MKEIKKHLKLNCPVCKKGRMRFAGVVTDETPEF